MKAILTLAPWVLLLLATPAFAQVADGNVRAGEVTPYPLAFFAPYSPVTARDLVGRIPGFEVDGGNDARGLSGAAGNVLIDGQRPPGKSDIWDILSRIRASQVERIDLIRDGAPGIDMQGKSLVINVIRVPERGGYSYVAETGGVWVPRADRYDGFVKLTGARELANGAQFDGEIYYDRAGGQSANPGGTRLRVGPTGNVITDVSNLSDDGHENLSGRASAEFGLFGGEAKLTGSLERGTDSRWATERVNGVERLTESEGKETEGEVEATYAYEMAGGGNLQAIVSQNWSDETSNTRSLSGRPPTGDEGEEKGGKIDASVDYPISAALRSLTVFARSWNTQSSTSSSIRAGGTLSSETDNEETGETALRTTLFFKPRETLSFEAGAEGAYNVLEGASEIAFGGVSVPVPGSQAKVDEKRGEVFTVATWAVQANLTVEGALRHEFSTLSASGVSKDLAFTKPMVQAKWEVAPRRQITARVEREVGQLDFGDFLSSASISEFDEFITAGATDLTPTQTWVSSLQYDHQFWETGTLKLRGEHRAISDIIDTLPVVTPDGTFEATGNIGEGSQAYFNAKLDAPLDNLGLSGARLSLDANLLLASEMTDPFTGEERRFGWDRDHYFSVDFEHDIGALNATWGFNASTQSPRFSWRSNSEEISEDAPNFSAFAIWRPDPKSTVRLDVRNIGPGHSESRREVHTGQRDLTPISYVEYRRNERATSLKLTYRRTHG